MSDIAARVPRLTFEECFARLIGSEGAFTNDPKDRGNWTTGRIGVGVNKGTKYGISAMSYPTLDIANLTLNDAKKIYFNDWWLKCGGDLFDPAILYQVWQFSVNAGIGNGKRCLQRAARVADDGDIGPASVAAIKSMDLNDVLERFLAATIRFYTKTSPEQWNEYGRGWMNRVATQLDFAAEDN